MSSAKDYVVGYARPPAHSRFKKGVCPNPAGRRGTKPKTRGSVLAHVLNREGWYKENGVTKRATLLEIILRRLAAEAMAGDVAAARYILTMRAHFEQHGDVAPIRIEVTEDDLLV